ncbi:MAG TPA: histidine kinase, partial [Thiolinea sp.]|nr:histidine kinase [Thiolinea sp.]
MQGQVEDRLLIHFLKHNKAGRRLINLLDRGKLQSSLLIRVGGMLAAIILMGLVGLSVSWMVADTAQGNGAAINIAGSLRMQGWRMVALQAQQDRPGGRETLLAAITRFESDLNSAPIQSVLPTDATSPLNQTYHQIAAHWHAQIRPALEISPEQSVLPSQSQEMSAFVALIDHLVKQVEEATEAKIFVLRVILGVSLIGTALVAALSVYLLNSLLVVPLKDLLALTGQLRQGNLAARTTLAGEDEIGQLGEAFNLMAHDLSKLYQNLESRVEQKTAELTRSNRSLDLLYRSISRLHGMTPDHTVFHAVLKDAENLLGLENGTLCLMETQDSEGRIIATTGPDGTSPLCGDQRDCVSCNFSAPGHLEPHADGQRLRLPLTNADKHYGMLAVDIPAGTATEHWQVQLLEALSHHIGVTIASEQRIEQNRRVSLLEERAVIARELHDSLAQSLAYMRIQVSRLRHALRQGPMAATEDEAAEALEELREGLNSSYQQLRELLSTFRLRMEDADLGHALEQTGNEFAARSGLNITLRFGLDHLSLSPHEEIHLLQIVREALSNVVKHAQADQAWVVLEPGAAGVVCLRVEDNGIGIRKSAAMHHYGMAIMEERARALHGMIRYLARAGGGTVVQLDFIPGHPRPAMPETRTH